MKNCLFSRICVALLTMCSCLTVQSQETEQKPHWYVGVMGGYRFGGASISELDKEIFPDAEGRNSGLFSLFVQYEWGQERQFAVRPELTFLSRGLKLPGIGKDLVTEDITYSLKSRYVDVRVPIIWNIGKYDWALRPYIYAAPIVGFSTGVY